MSSIQSAGPKGFFSLPPELRNEIYDILHQLQDEVAFGIDEQLVVRFPLPRIHHISRQFTTECDGRAPSSPPLIEVSQVNKDFYSIRSNDPTGPRNMATSSLLLQPKCPRVLYLRSMRIQPLMCKLHISMHIPTNSDGLVCEELEERLPWIQALIQNTSSLANTDNVCVRLTLDDADCIYHLMGFPRSKVLKAGAHIGGRIALIDEFAEKVLARCLPGTCLWEFDDQEIERCRAAAVFRSLRSKATGGPGSSDGEGFSKGEEFGEDDEPDDEAEFM